MNTNDDGNDDVMIINSNDDGSDDGNDDGNDDQ